MLRTGEFFRIKKKQKAAKHRQNPRGKPDSVCFPPETGRLIHLSAGQYTKTLGKIYTAVAYQEDSECSWVAELQFWLKSDWKSMAKLENGCLAMINNQLKKFWKE